MYLPPLLEGFLGYGSFAESLKRIFCGFDPVAEVFPSGMFYWLFTLILFTFQNKTRAECSGVGHGELQPHRPSECEHALDIAGFVFSVPLLAPH